MNLEVLGRILHREPWGVKARVEEVPPGCTSVAVSASPAERAVLCVADVCTRKQVGDIYWTKWGGETVPMISRPILEVVHQVGHAAVHSRLSVTDAPTTGMQQWKK